MLDLTHDQSNEKDLHHLNNNSDKGIEVTVAKAPNILVAGDSLTEMNSTPSLRMIDSTPLWGIVNKTPLNFLSQQDSIQTDLESPCITPSPDHQKELDNQIENQIASKEQIEETTNKEDVVKTNHSKHPENQNKESVLIKEYLSELDTQIYSSFNVESPKHQKRQSPLPLAGNSSFSNSSSTYNSITRISKLLGDKYEIRTLIGQGGMGWVYEAAQIHPVRRKVAIKLIRPGMDSQDVLDRFNLERYTLARMNHANIAAVYDAGVTASNQPFVVMELVDGIPLMEYCNSHQLSIKERLKLFIQICNGLQHAHQKGIIHRDLKPSNILVSKNGGEAICKIIDFGIAKIIKQGNDDSDFLPTPSTIDMIVGTPIYMSPEQAGFMSGDIDTRSDIYSLGILLYELLSGLLPFPEAEKPPSSQWLHIWEVIRDQDPPQMTNRVKNHEDLEQILRNRRLKDRYQFQKELCGDLEWITVKAIEKDRDRRYQSIEALSEDIQRFFKDEPISAGPPSNIYRLKKFYRRNRRAVQGLVSLVICLCAGILGTSIGLMRASTAEMEAHKNEMIAQNALLEEHKAIHNLQLAMDVLNNTRVKLDSSLNELIQANLEVNQQKSTAEFRAKELNAFADFLVNDVLAAARPEEQPGGLGVKVSVKDAILVAGKDLDKKFKDLPLAEAITRVAIGKTLHNLGEYNLAENHLRLAVKIRSKLLPKDDFDLLTARYHLAITLLALENVKNSKDILTDLLDICSQPKVINSFKTKGTDLTHSIRHHLVTCLIHLKQWPEARKLVEENITQLKNAPNKLSQYESEITSLATILIYTGNPSGAVHMLQPNLSNLQHSLGKNNLVVLKREIALAKAHSELGNFKAAIPILSEVLQHFQVHLGLEHPEVLDLRVSLGKTYLANNDYDMALHEFEEVQRIYRTKLPPNHPYIISIQHQIVQVYLRSGHGASVISIAVKNLQLLKASPYTEATDIIPAQLQLAECYAQQDSLANSKLITNLLENCLVYGNPPLPIHHPLILETKLKLASHYMLLEKHTEVVKLLDQVLYVIENDKKSADRFRASSHIDLLDHLAYSYHKLQNDRSLVCREKLLSLLAKYPSIKRNTEFENHLALLQTYRSFHEESRANFHSMWLLEHAPAYWDRNPNRAIAIAKHCVFSLPRSNQIQANKFLQKLTNKLRKSSKPESSDSIWQNLEQLAELHAELGDFSTATITILEILHNFQTQKNVPEHRVALLQLTLARLYLEHGHTESAHKMLALCQPAFACNPICQPLAWQWQIVESLSQILSAPTSANKSQQLENRQINKTICQAIKQLISQPRVPSISDYHLVVLLNRYWQRSNTSSTSTDDLNQARSILQNWLKRFQSHLLEDHDFIDLLPIKNTTPPPPKKILDNLAFQSN